MVLQAWSTEVILLARCFWRVEWIYFLLHLPSTKWLIPVMKISESYLMGCFVASGCCNLIIHWLHWNLIKPNLQLNSSNDFVFNCNLSHVMQLTAHNFLRKQCQGRALQERSFHVVKNNITFTNCLSTTKINDSDVLTNNFMCTYLCGRTLIAFPALFSYKNNQKEHLS